MERAVTLLAGMGLGAGLMYILDPDMGRRRRAYARDRAMRLAHDAEEYAGDAYRAARERAGSWAAGAEEAVGQAYRSAREGAGNLASGVQEAAGEVYRDARHRAEALASGNFSAFEDDWRALRNPLRGRWSPTARTMMALVGGGLFLYGLSKYAPTACVLGTAGVGLAAEGIANADLTRIPETVASTASSLAGSVASSLGVGGQEGHGHQAGAPQPAGARG